MNSNDDEYGYDPIRFQNVVTDQFVCPICTNVAKDPRVEYIFQINLSQECVICGALFCNSCMSQWKMKNKNECPRGRCNLLQNPIRPISGALARIYNNLDIKCKHQSCGKILKLCDIEQHELQCQQPKCKNFDICENHVKQEMMKDGVCDLSCLLLSKIRPHGSNYTKVLTEIKNFLKQQPQYQRPAGNMDYPSQVMAPPQMVGSAGQLHFSWSQQHMGTGIQLTLQNKHCFLKESAYMFRTVLGDTPLMSGQHYWELVADGNTENELKIGVATKREFNYNSAFCDYEFGFSYYGLGQLRANSNAAGPQYGKRFKKEGVLSVFLDMNKGTLSFGLNGENWGVAFSNAALKKGPIFPAVSLLHCAGCRLVTGKAIPPQFIN